LALGDAGSYVCLGGDDVHPSVSPYAVSNTAILTVADHVSITTQPNGADLYVNGSDSTVVVGAGGIGGLRYQWFKDGTAIPGQTQSTYAYATVQPVDAGNYRCDVSDTNETVQSNVAVLTVSGHVAITTEPVAATTVTVGDPLTLSVVATGGKGPLHYQWKLNANNVGTDSPNYVLLTVMLADEGTYTCTVTDVPAGTETVISADSVVTVLVTFAFDQQPADAQIYEYGAMTMTSHVIGMLGNVTYQWLLNGNPIPGATADSYSLTSALLTDAGPYSVQATDDGFGPPYPPGYPKVITSATATLQVIGHMWFITPPDSVSVNPGATATFTAAVVGGMGAITYQWQKDGVDITDATTTAYVKTGVQATDNGTSYTCTASDANESVTSVAAILTVLIGPGVPVAGGLGLAVLAGAFALAGVFSVRRKRQ
jgi:hypothetical protein